MFTPVCWILIVCLQSKRDNLDFIYLNMCICKYAHCPRTLPTHIAHCSCRHTQTTRPYCQQLECHPLHAAVLCICGLKCLVRDYFPLVARCIVHACASHSYIMSSAQIIDPKSQWWSG